jgi:bifunctional non-homologous end joining protein LigD
MAKRKPAGESRKKARAKAGGAAGRAPGGAYVIQKHAASRLHYDLRLEAGGVMKSWAVPKGPSLSTKQKRLAVQVEDHPVEYNGFEGIIPEGYGAGTVMIWDLGTYECLPEGKTGPVPDPAEAIAGGFIRFRLDGKKLRGAWKLFKFRGERNWLLAKSSDEFVDHETDILEAEPDSAATGRSMEEIAASGDVYDGSCGAPG